jgi:hypothetical protein
MKNQNLSQRLSSTFSTRRTTAQITQLTSSTKNSSRPLSTRIWTGTSFEQTATFSNTATVTTATISNSNFEKKCKHNNTVHADQVIGLPNVLEIVQMILSDKHCYQEIRKENEIGRRRFENRHNEQIRETDSISSAT